jgi:hypothetical protein
MYDQLEFVHKIHSDALDWYKTAERKAEILLGLIGTFVALASGVILIKPDDMRSVVSTFNTIVWAGLALTFSAMLFALFAAYQCLKSRMKRAKPVPTLNQPGTMYPEEEMLFFQHHARHEQDRLSDSLIHLDKVREIEIYSSQIIALSKNVVLKHRWINKGLQAVVLCILLMIATTVIYLSQIKTLSHRQIVKMEERTN